MAPSPEHDNEPKAPDKKATATANKIGSELLDLESSSADLQESSVSTLDDGQLKALLDEAINYKCPKDREGKSKIFKVLLQEAEEDERNARAASASGPQLARYYNTSAAAGLRHRHRGGGVGRSNQQSVSESLTHGGSLQNLAQPELFDPSPYLGGSGSHCRRRTGGKKGTVSARQREGGSLPSNVNSTGGRSFISTFETQRTKMSIEVGPITRSEQSRVNNNEAVAEKVVANSRCGGGDYVIDLTGHVDPDETKSLLDHDVLGHNYESSMTFSPHETCVSSQQKEQIPIVNRIRTNIDSAIAFPQLMSTSCSSEGNFQAITAPLQLEANYNSVKSIVDATASAEIKTEPLSITASLRPTPLRMTPSSNHLLVGRQPLQQLDLSVGAKKAFDENGNALSSMDSNGRTKKKKPRSEKKVTITVSEAVVGHRADIIEDIDLLVKYVESSDAEGANNTAKRGPKHHQQQRRSASGRTLNSKGNKGNENAGVKKSNSLEEISTSKLEDLVISKGDRRSWGTEDGEQYYCKKLQEQTTEPLLPTPTTDTPIEMSEFQVVNKKKKSRKRRTDQINSPPASSSHMANDDDSTPSSQSINTPRNRRKSSCSMPVSDKSDKSDSSDLDSVHSLPMSAKLGDLDNSLPMPAKDLDSVHLPMSAKVVSYADITSTVERMDVENSSLTQFLNSVEHFPELCRSVNAVSVSDVNPSVFVMDRRPAVIIPVSSKDGEVSGITFGFEVNEQLLALEPDVLLDSEFAPVNSLGTADSFTARFVPPVVVNNYNHDKIVSYVGQEWEKIVHQPAGKVRYYSGQ